MGRDQGSDNAMCSPLTPTRHYPRFVRSRSRHLLNVERVAAKGLWGWTSFLALSPLPPPSLQGLTPTLRPDVNHGGDRPCQTSELSYPRSPTKSSILLIVTKDSAIHGRPCSSSLTTKLVEPWFYQVAKLSVRGPRRKNEVSDQTSAWIDRILWDS